MDFICYLQIRRDAWIHMLRQTKDGREYLFNAWRIEQTESERGKLRAKFVKG